MESRGRRGSRGSIEPPAPEIEAAAVSAAAVPEVATPSPDESIIPPSDESTAPQTTEDAVAAGGDSLTALAVAEEALARSPEPTGGPAPSGADAQRMAGNLCPLDRDSLAAVARSQAALARGMTTLGAEIAALALSEFDTAARAATRLLAVRTLSDAMALQVDYARSSLEAALAGATRLSQLGVELAADAAEPLVAQFGRNWVKAVRRAG
jgi:hypothetical protein